MMAMNGPTTVICRIARRARGFAPVIFSTLALPLAATHPLPGPHFIHCRSDGDTVRLEWDELGYTDQSSLEARMERDGRVIASLRSSSLGYVDRGVPAGEHTYRLAIVQGERNIDSQECRVSVGAGVPPPEAIQCSVQAQTSVELQWRNAAAYDAVDLLRDGAEVAHLEGSATRFSDEPGPGLHLYQVRGVVRGELSAPARCEADLGGTPVHRLHLLMLQPRVGDLVGVPPASDQLAVLLDNAYPVTAWSFGLCSDPDFIVPVAFEATWLLEESNLGAGPEFLALDLHPGGLTMRAVINDADPSAALGAGLDQRLLTLAYGGGPLAVAGDVYPLEFCDNLGQPPVPISLVVNGREVRPATESGFVLANSARFLRGDSNVDGEINLTDGITTLEWLFLGGRRPACPDAADVDSSREVSISDPIYTFNFLFLGGPEPPAPFPGCQSAVITLGCEGSACP
jgi:hypothetical protein